MSSVWGGTPGFLKNGAGAHVDRSCNYFFGLQVALPQIILYLPQIILYGHSSAKEMAMAEIVRPSNVLLQLGWSFVAGRNVG